MVDLSRSSLALLVGITACALVLASSLVIFGVITDADPSTETGLPHANFLFEEESDIEHGTFELGVRIEYQSGVDLPLEEVNITVNGARALDLQPTDDGDPQVTEPWADPDGSIADAPARVVVYENPQEDEYEPLEPGDVIEVVWRDEERMTVLQRYVVEA